ncbi:MAG: HIT domain-containing protein [Dehalococcoidia bacterium]|nr:HIT domain-containing protein [Dehalococcoidia bacterium]
MNEPSPRRWDCVFCEIVAHEEYADILYEDSDVIVFRNLLRWVPLMLLAVPKQHMTQAQLWTDPMIAKVSKVAAQIGVQQCPSGFRLLSNFGLNAMQSQEHGHLHIIGGVHLGPYA